jgi:mannose/fructose/N-acetylgalactosamine-specific phosphotransferase system component IIC
MDLKLVFFAVVAISVMVVGLIEWLKAGLPNIPNWLPWALSPVGCIGFAALAAPLIQLNGWWFAVLGFLSLAVTEVGYQTIVQGLKNAVSAISSAAAAKVAAPVQKSAQANTTSGPPVSGTPGQGGII